MQGFFHKLQGIFIRWVGDDVASPLFVFGREEVEDLVAAAVDEVGGADGMAGLFEDVGKVLLATGAFPDVLVEVLDLQEETCGYGVGGVEVVGLTGVGRVVGGTKGFEDGPLPASPRGGA